MCQVLAILYNWQTLITGGLAICAAVIGGRLAYRAGIIQAEATRNSAEKQVLANAKPICILMPYDGVDPWYKRDTLLTIFDHPSPHQRFGIVQLQCSIRNVGPGSALNVAIMFRFLDMSGYTTSPWELSPFYAGECRGGETSPLQVPIQIIDQFNDADFSQIAGKAWQILLTYEDVFGNPFYSVHHKSPIQVDRYFSSQPIAVPQAWVTFGEGKLQ
jgi:hypothetical protein